MLLSAYIVFSSAALTNKNAYIAQKHRQGSNQANHDLASLSSFLFLFFFRIVNNRWFTFAVKHPLQRSLPRCGL